MLAIEYGEVSNISKSRLLSMKRCVFSDFLGDLGCGDVNKNSLIIYIRFGSPLVGSSLIVHLASLLSLACFW